MLMVTGSNYLPVVQGERMPSVQDRGRLVVRERGVVHGGEVIEVKRKWWQKKFKIETVKDIYEFVENPMKTYQVIPHAKGSGNTRRLWSALHKMYEMYSGVRERVDREGIKFTHREKDTLWYDIVFRQEDGKKRVEFYISTSEYQSEKLKRKIENMMNVTLKEEDREVLEVPVNNTDVKELKYARHDIFSLSTHVSEKQTPIGSILNTVEELQFDGDVARFSVYNEVEERERWVKNATWAREKLGRGVVPQRANGAIKGALPLIKTGAVGIMNEVNSIVIEMFNAVSKVFFKDAEDVKAEKVVAKGHTLEDEINATRLSTASLEKVNRPVFKSRIRVATHSGDRLTRDTMGESLVLAMTDVAGDNEFKSVRVRNKEKAIQELNTLKVGKNRPLDVNKISTDEMSRLVLQMPTQELQLKYVDALNTRKKVEAVVPNELQKDTNLRLGDTVVKDKEIPVGLNTEEKDEFYCGYTFIGKQGSGKDTAIQNFVYEGAVKHGISFIVMDWIGESGHRGMADGIRDLLPEDKVIDIDLANEDWIVPLDLTEVVEKLGRKGGSRFAMEMIDMMDLGELPRSQKYLMEASKASGGSLSKMKRIIEDEEYRLKVVEGLMESGDVRTAKDLVNWGTNDELGNKCDAILSRLNRFFGDDTLHNIFSQPPKAEVNFEEWMAEGKTIILRMPKRILGGGSNVLAHWVTLKVLMTRMLMSHEDKEKHGCFMVFNEPEQVETKGMSELMGRIATEGRKERLGSIFAFHHWDKLPIYLQQNLQAGGVNQLLFASDHKKTYENVKERLYPTFTVEDALSTPKYHAVALINTKEQIPAFLMKMSKPVPSEERYNNQHLTKEHVKRYGRRWEELQEMLI